MKEGKVATVHLEFYQARFDTLLTLKVLMRDKGGYWQVFDLSDFTYYTRTLDELERRRVERINQVALKLFNAHVKLVDINVVSRPMSSFGDIFKENVFSVTLENTSQKEIDVLTYIFNFVHPTNGSRRGYIYDSPPVKLTGFSREI